MPGEDGDFGGDFPGLTDVGAATLTRVLAFGVLAHDDPVEITGFAVFERRDGTAKDFCGPNIGVLLEGLAYGEAETPEGYVVRDI